MKINKTDWAKLIGILIVFAGGLTASYYILKPIPKLPVYNPTDLDERLVDVSIQRHGRNHKILDFNLTNQYGESFSLDELKGKIFIADFFFTTCPSICKDMAVQKRRLQEIFKNDSSFVLVSHSVTPETDSVPIMKEYADRHGAIKGKWQLLTGDKPQIYKLARQSYFAIFDEGGNGDEADFIHTENFVLIDTRKRIRGFYDGTSAESVDQLIKDIALLKENG